MTKGEWLHFYVVFGLCLAALKVGVRLWLLSVKQYPRTLTWSRSEDATTVALGVGWIVFLVWLMWGPQ